MTYAKLKLYICLLSTIVCLLVRDIFQNSIEEISQLFLSFDLFSHSPLTGRDGIHYADQLRLEFMLCVPLLTYLLVLTSAGLFVCVRYYRLFQENATSAH